MLDLELLPLDALRSEPMLPPNVASGGEAVAGEDGVGVGGSCAKNPEFQQQPPHGLEDFSSRTCVFLKWR